MRNNQAKEIERETRKIPNQRDTLPKKKETHAPRIRKCQWNQYVMEWPNRTHGQRTKNVRKIIKIKKIKRRRDCKNITWQRGRFSRRSEPYGDSQYQPQKERRGIFKQNWSTEEEKSRMHMYRKEEFKEDFKEIEESDEEDRLTKEK